LKMLCKFLNEAQYVPDATRTFAGLDTTIPISQQWDSFKRFVHVFDIEHDDFEKLYPLLHGFTTDVQAQNKTPNMARVAVALGVGVENSLKRTRVNSEWQRFQREVSPFLKTTIAEAKAEKANADAEKAKAEAAKALASDGNSKGTVDKNGNAKK
jgi:hypothetical protein